MVRVLVGLLRDTNTKFCACDLSDARTFTSGDQHGAITQQGSGVQPAWNGKLVRRTPNPHFRIVDFRVRDNGRAYTARNQNQAVRQ